MSHRRKHHLTIILASIPGLPGMQRAEAYDEIDITALPHAPIFISTYASVAADIIAEGFEKGPWLGVDGAAQTGLTDDLMNLS
jgi:hypothetical protein